MFPSCALCFISSLSRTLQLPLTLVYCTSLILLRSCSHIPLRRIHSLVYISPVLVATNLRTNIICLPSYLSEVPSECLETLAWLWLSCFSSVLVLVLPSMHSGEDSRYTGGKGQYTQWVHCELIVGSETICLAHTQRVNGGHFQKVPTHLPSPNPAGK